MPPIPRKANGFEAARPDEAVDQACTNGAAASSDAQDADMLKINRIRWLLISPDTLTSDTP